MGEEVLMRLVEEIELVGPIRFDELLLEALLEDWDEVDRLVLVGVTILFSILLKDFSSLLLVFFILFDCSFRLLIVWSLVSVFTSRL